MRSDRRRCRGRDHGRLPPRLAGGLLDPRHSLRRPQGRGRSRRESRGVSLWQGVWGMCPQFPKKPPREGGWSHPTSTVGTPPTARPAPSILRRPNPPRQPTPQAEGAGRACLVLCRLPLSPTLAIPYPTPMPTRTRLQPHEHRIRQRFLQIESCAWRASSQLRIRKSDRIPWPMSNATTKGGHAAPTLQASTLLRGTVPRPSPAPKLRVQGLPCCLGIVSHTPSAAPFPYLRLVPRSPSAAFVSYLDRANPTRDWQTSAKLARLSHRRTNERIQATPILPRFKFRSWTAPAQAAAGRKTRAERYDSNRMTGGPHHGLP